MLQPIEVFVPWPVVIMGIVLALALTALILVLLVKAFGKRLRELEEEAGEPAYRERKKEAEKLCPRCDTSAPLSAKFCPGCGKAI